MRFVLLAALFAVGGLTSPVGKRDFVTDVVVVTDVVYVTEGQGQAAATSVAVAAVEATVTVTESSNSYGHHHHSEPSSTSVAVAAAATTSAVVEAANTPVAAAQTTTPAATSESAPSTASSAPVSSGTDYNSQVIYHHNVHRANHSASDVVWDENLYKAALAIASTCVYAHNLSAISGPYGPSGSGYEGYGQNIAAGYPASGISGTISDLFYNGEVNSFLPSYYGQANPPDFESWGHFSQIVWADTTNVGCATVDCSASGLANFGDVDAYFTVCNYWPEGNMGGEYGSNILASLDEPTVTGVSS